MDARSYPVARVWEEAEIVAKRVNNQTASEMILLQLAVSSVLTKKAGEEFKRQIKRLTGD